MQIDYLETLVEAAALGSFSRAAEKLCITQSAVSKRIRFLEEHYGYPLLDRSGPQITPTPAGQLVIEKARRLIEIEHELEQGLEGLDRRRGISFCCTPAFGIAHLPDVMRRLMLHDPDMSQVRFYFDTPENIVKGVLEQRFDIAVVEYCARPELGDFRVVALPRDEMVFVSAPSLWLPTPKVPLDTLLAQNLLYRREGCCSRIFLGTNLERLGRTIADFRSSVLIDDLHLILQATTSGNGIAFVSRSVVEPQLRAGSLVAHHVPGFEHHRDRALVWSECHKPTATQAHFLESVLETFQVTAPEALPATP